MHLIRYVGIILLRNIEVPSHQQKTAFSISGGQLWDSPGKLAWPISTTLKCLATPRRSIYNAFGRYYNTKGLKLKPSKCTQGLPSVEFLRHIVSLQGLALSPTKLAALNDLVPPTNVTEARSFTSLASQYRRFIKNLALIAHLLHQLMQKGFEFKWTTECQEAFTE